MVIIRMHSLLSKYSAMLYCCISLFLLISPNTVISSETALYKIVAIQHQDFLPYTNAYKGFTQGIKDSGLSKNITIELYNTQNDLAALDQKIIEIKNRDDIDLIFAMGTQSTTRVVKKIKNIPVIFTVVGSPQESGLISNWKSSGSNLTGIGTPNQIIKSIEQLYSVAKFKSIGITYLSGSPNHEAVVKQIKIFCKKYGIKFIYDDCPFKTKDGGSVPDDLMSECIKNSLDYVLPQVDVFYVQSSATYEKEFDIFRKAFRKYNVPSIGEPVYIKKGVMIGIGVNDYIFGKQAAEYAVKILFHGTKPSELPMDTGTKFSILVNLESANAVEFDPQLLMPIINSADSIYQRIEKW